MSMKTKEISITSGNVIENEWVNGLNPAGVGPPPLPQGGTGRTPEYRRGGAASGHVGQTKAKP